MRRDRVHSFILMYKGESVPDTRRPRQLAARIDLQPQTDPLRVHVGQACNIKVEIENTGDTLWLADTPDLAGWTRLGVRLHAADDTTTLLDGDWQRALLPHDMAAGDVVTIEVELPPIDAPGAYLMVFDMVAEDVAWFADVNSPTTHLCLLVVSLES